MAPLSLAQLTSLGLLFLVGLSNAYIESEPIDEGLYNCLEMETRNMSVEDFPAAGIMHSCVQSFLALTTDLRYHSNITIEEVAWVGSLVRKYASKRHKRQAGIPRIRQEIRRITDQQRGALFEAFNVLKQNGRYDTLASFHQNMAITSAHNGPNFLGWHRVYLLALEEALMEVNPRVTLPYWDSTLDFDMNDPIQSAVWTSQFFGNGDGVVNTGPFSNWVVEGGGLLTRNIGSFGTSLMQKRLINNIINPNNNVRFHWQITVWYGQRPWLRQNVLERQHDGVHAWVGGLMRGLSTSAHDPVFFFHHCFIDYLWEQFRLKQRNLGFDSSNDYLPDFYLRDRPAHFRNRLMDGFPDYRNIDGYSDRFTRDIYQYERSPVCPACGSPYLFCDNTRGVCVSADSSAMGESRSSAAGFGGVSVASLAAQAQGPLALGETFTSSFADPRARNTPLPSGPRADGAGSAFGAFTDDGTGTGTNLATNLLRTSSARGQANSNMRRAMMNSMSGNRGQSTAQMFRGPFNMNQGMFGPIQLLQGRQAGLSQQVPQNGMGTIAHNGMQANAQNRMQAMTRNGMTSMSQNGMPTMAHNSMSGMSHNSMPMMSQNGNQMNSGHGGFNPNQNMPPQAIAFPSNSGLSSAINQGIQNTFTLDGVSDVNRWAFMPVRVVYRRPEGLTFDGRNIRQGQVENGFDMYNPTIYSQMKRYMHRGAPATYPKCPKYGSGAGKIFIETNGINYAGTFKDYAMIDARQPVTESYTYVGFRNPSLGASRTFVHAYDSYGRVCQPRCLVRHSNPPRYVPCSGAINSNTRTPRMYGNSFGEAVLGRWDFKSDYCPQSYNGEVFMTFYCDYAKGWPWRDCNKNIKKPLIVRTVKRLHGQKALRGNCK
ncbi:uncharacterized protein LOC110463699 [Mizuhopecten yessoensis]|uniref:Tyrosinase-like protein 2 n=1 Tax=Mizuhopecten yessoensis TaxID=6573 RepID=A0A210R2J1_MIZYE|nr:uncharacterized protein LOC110463699 [Mizuhopecten yessoensis]OWF55164.1 Tyrosinase-like protein 2 [Mizuhopecten yessoensis]